MTPLYSPAKKNNDIEYGFIFHVEYSLNAQMLATSHTCMHSCMRSVCVGLDLQQQAFKYLRVQASQHLYERVVFNLDYCDGS